jgi:hypothetical protein
MVSPSLPLLRRALAWGVEQGMSVRDQLTEEQLGVLERVFTGNEPWSFDYYQPLRAFAHALARMNLPDLPPLSFGDAVQALDELRAHSIAAWPTHGAVSEATFRELGYASTSAGITRIRDANAASWRDHGLNNKEILLRGAERAGGSRAAVVGAGKLYDIPLRKLAERFDEVVLVDIDEASLAESVKQSGLDPKLQARLSLVQNDVTGINDAFLERARSAFARATEDEVYAALLSVLHDYRVDEPPSLLPEGDMKPLDYACSSMVLSQLATPLTQYVERHFAERFPTSTRAKAQEFQVALGQFTHRVQHAHVRSLITAAPCVALTSDIADQYVGLDPRGVVVSAPLRLPLIGAGRLDGLVPGPLGRSAFIAEWEWRHVVPTRSKPHGRTVQVAGIVVLRTEPQQ